MQSILGYANGLAVWLGYRDGEMPITVLGEAIRLLLQ